VSNVWPPTDQCFRTWIRTSSVSSPSQHRIKIPPVTRADPQHYPSTICSISFIYTPPWPTLPILVDFIPLALMYLQKLGVAKLIDSLDRLHENNPQVLWLYLTIFDALRVLDFLGVFGASSPLLEDFLLDFVELSPLLDFLPSLLLDFFDFGLDKSTMSPYLIP